VKSPAERLASLGPSSQAAIPGLYAWAVTVASCGLARGVPWQTRILVVLGPLALVAAIAIDRDRPHVARNVSLWGLVGSSLLVWALVPAAVGPSRFDAVRGVMGMLGWGAFAFTLAAPAFPRREADDARVIERGRLPPRQRSARWRGVILVAGVAFAAALQAIGWEALPRERALLVRLYTLLAGMAVLGVFAEIAVAGQVGRSRKVHRGAYGWAAVALVVGGLALGLELSAR